MISSRLCHFRLQSYIIPSTNGLDYDYMNTYHPYLHPGPFDTESPHTVFLGLYCFRLCL